MYSFFPNFEIRAPQTQSTSGYMGRCKIKGVGIVGGVPPENSPKTAIVSMIFQHFDNMDAAVGLDLPMDQ